jgi:hypothetical protein
VSLPAIPSGTQALIRAPDGARVLLNGGPTTGSAVGLLGEQLRPWDRAIDLVVLSDPREAYVLGLARVFERYRVGAFLDAVDDYPSAAYRQARTAAGRAGVRRLRAELGTQIAVGRDLTLEILAPESDGRSAPDSDSAPAPGTVTLRLRWGAFSLLIPAEPAAGRRPSGEALPASTAVLLSDRAARQPATPALLHAASPELALVQGTPPASPTPVRSPSAPLQAPAPDADGPHPTWYRTADDGPIHLEVRPDGYRLTSS